MGLALVLLALAPMGAEAREEILSYDTLIRVEIDASLTVRETIVVRAEGREIRRGIYRSFSTRAKETAGRVARAPIDILNVFKDGLAEPYRVERSLDGKRIYIGDPDTLLEPGTYTYTIEYAVDDQLLFHDDGEELYWNAVGHDWVFPIQKARTEVLFPAASKATEISVYTGVYGANGTNFRLVADETSRVVVETKNPLRPTEGLTVSIRWPKGFVERPAIPGLMTLYLREHAASFIAGGGLGGLIVYYLAVWFRVGRDPAPGTVIPRFRPPEDLSPAALRYVRRMGADRKGFAAALISMGVQGVLTIDEEDDGDYRLTRTGKSFDDLYPGERRIAKTLFEGRDSIVLSQSNHKTLQRAIKRLNETLESEYENRYFVTNIRFFAIGILVTLGIVALSAVFSTGPAETAFLGLWLSVWTTGVVFLVARAIGEWRVALTRPVRSIGA
ncbi:MAG: DUF2207 domain-containing protein, partial [Pseudomonadota bacterium]